MENSPLHVCRLQPARSELISALLDAGGAFGARNGGSFGRRFCFVLSPEVVHQRSIIFSDFQRLQIDLLGDESWKTGTTLSWERLEITATSIPKRGNSLPS
jgi:hypothetical protein